MTVCRTWQLYFLFKFKYIHFQRGNTKVFSWSIKYLTKSTSGSRSPAGEGRLEMTHKVRILHITCWQHINEMLTEPKRLASYGTRNNEHSTTTRSKQQWWWGASWSKQTSSTTSGRRGGAVLWLGHCRGINCHLICSVQFCTMYIYILLM